MQTGTFYIASSIKNIPRVKECAADLEAHGMRWCNGYIWASFEEIIEQEGLLKDSKNGEHVLTAMAARDIAGAIGASVFVLYMCPEYKHQGSFVELGARAGNHRECHVIRNGYEDVFFFHLPNVVIHETWEDFMTTMFPHAGYVPSAIKGA